jgi:hypothetical protein
MSVEKKQIAHDRGCGIRKAGMIYHVVDEDTIGNSGSAWAFAVDPPIPMINPEGMGISAQGISVLPRCNMLGIQEIDDAGVPIFDAWDWVGYNGYPNAADFLMEVEAMGVSRLFPKTTGFNKLTAASYHILVHPRAIINEASKIHQRRLSWEGHLRCPQSHDIHITPMKDEESTCASMWVECVEGATRFTKHTRMGRREMPSFSYLCGTAPQKPKISFGPGIFMRFPLRHFEIVVDTEMGTHEKALEMLGKLGSGMTDKYRMVNY